MPRLISPSGLCAPGCTCAKCEIDGGPTQAARAQAERALCIAERMRARIGKRLQRQSELEQAHRRAVAETDARVGQLRQVRRPTADEWRELHALRERMFPAKGR